MKALDLFAGPGGWDVPDAELGLESDGVELDESARMTRKAAGLLTVGRDVAEYKLPTDHSYRMLKASPPCQTYSLAGNGAGRKALDLVLREMAWAARGVPVRYSKFEDNRTGLVLEPMRIVYDSWEAHNPFELIAFEQVPSVLPVWKLCADYLTRWGYSVACGIISAEQYGVPQVRKRAVLIASLNSRVVLPTPTHSKFYSHDPYRLDEGVLPWVSMASALGWGMTGRPSMTVTGGGTGGGGAEPFGNRARAGMRREAEAQRWEMRSNYTKGGDLTGRNTRRADLPSLAVTGNIGKNAWQPTEGAGRWEHADPDVSGKGLRVSVAEAAVLQTFPEDYPFQGTKTQQYQQVGNAIPPLLAKALLKELIRGVDS